MGWREDRNKNIIEVTTEVITIKTIQTGITEVKVTATITDVAHRTLFDILINMLSSVVIQSVLFFWPW